MLLRSIHIVFQNILLSNAIGIAPLARAGALLIEVHGSAGLVSGVLRAPLDEDRDSHLKCPIGQMLAKSLEK